MNVSLTPFLEACGATGPFEVGIASARHPEPIRYLLQQPFAVLGRDPRADLMLHDAAISQRHAYLQILDGRAFSIDLGSRLGVSWKSERRAAGWLDPEQQLQIGSFQVCVWGGCLPEPLANACTHSPLQSQSAALAGLPEVKLLFTSDGSVRGNWTMNCRIALIGSSPQCKVRLEGISVSNFHCSLVRTLGGLWVVDLLGRGGITVNGQHVRYALLQEGDCLQVGRFVIHITAACIRESSTSSVQPVPEMVEEKSVCSAEYHTSKAFGTQSAETNYPLPSIRATMAVSNIEVRDSALSPLLNQFAMMQQQMFDQFQQAMLQMVHVFGALHREQMDAIRGELKDLRSLTCELQSLERQLLSIPAAVDRNSIEIPAGLTSVNASFDGSLANIDQLAAMFGEETLTTGNPIAVDEKRSANGAPTESLAFRTERIDTSPRSHSSEAAAPSPFENRTSPTPAAAPSESPVMARVGPAPGAAPSQEIHAFLCQRMATLQEERQSHWKKILGILTGSGRQK